LNLRVLNICDVIHFQTVRTTSRPRAIMAGGKAGKRYLMRNITSTRDAIDVEVLVPKRKMVALQLKGAAMERALAQSSSSEALLRSALFEESKNALALRTALVDLRRHHAALIARHTHVYGTVIVVAGTTTHEPTRVALTKLFYVGGPPSDTDAPPSDADAEGWTPSETVGE
jgi:hypothetical protein